VRVRGRLDRLERDSAGRLVVVDIKTGKTPVSKHDAQRHAQLAMYQLAVAEGLLPQGDTPGGGRLVYLGKTAAGGATEREQDPQTADTRAVWLELVVDRAGRPVDFRVVRSLDRGLDDEAIKAVEQWRFAPGTLAGAPVDVQVVVVVDFRIF